MHCAVKILHSQSRELPKQSVMESIWRTQCVCACACVAERVHVGYSTRRLERHLRWGFPQYPCLHRREGHHAPGQPETERVWAGEGAAECQDPSWYHERHRAVDHPLWRPPNVLVCCSLFRWDFFWFSWLTHSDRLTSWIIGLQAYFISSNAVWIYVRIIAPFLTKKSDFFIWPYFCTVCSEAISTSVVSSFVVIFHGSVNVWPFVIHVLVN